MMRGQVFLILMCIIFEHGRVAFPVVVIIICRLCFRSGTRAFLEDLAALTGQLEMLRVGCEAGGVLAA